MRGLTPVHVAPWTAGDYETGTFAVDRMSPTAAADPNYGAWTALPQQPTTPVALNTLKVEGASAGRVQIGAGPAGAERVLGEFCFAITPLVTTWALPALLPLPVGQRLAVRVSATAAAYQVMLGLTSMDNLSPGTLLAAPGGYYGERPSSAAGTSSSWGSITGDYEAPVKVLSLLVGGGNSGSATVEWGYGQGSGTTLLRRFGALPSSDDNLHFTFPNPPVIPAMTRLFGRTSDSFNIRMAALTYRADYPLWRVT